MMVTIGNNLKLNIMNKKNNGDKKGTIFYGIFATALSGGLSFGIYNMFGIDGVIISLLLMLILLASIIRYNI